MDHNIIRSNLQTIGYILRPTTKHPLNIYKCKHLMLSFYSNCSIVKVELHFSTRCKLSLDCFWTCCKVICVIWLANMGQIIFKLVTVHNSPLNVFDWTSESKYLFMVFVCNACVKWLYLHERSLLISHGDDVFKYRNIHANKCFIM